MTTYNSTCEVIEEEVEVSTADTERLLAGEPTYPHVTVHLLDYSRGGTALVVLGRVAVALRCAGAAVRQ